MKIIELNLEKFSLSNIAISFEELSDQEEASLKKLLFRVSKQTKQQSAILVFLSIYELSNLIETWNLPTGKEILQAIFKHNQVIWAGKNFSFDLTLNPIVYSIINVTPDSFYDGAAENLTLDYILKRVEDDLENGASVIELGGKSSRPGYSDISPQEEWLRLAKPIEEIKKRFPKAVLAIDTDEGYVMKRVLDAGVDIINDIDGFDTSEKLKLLQEYQPAVVAMNNGRAGFQFSDNVYEELPAFFKSKGEELQQLGLSKEKISIDPGVGFWNGPSGMDSLQRVKANALLPQLGYPVMVAISRKSFMTNIFKMAVEDRLVSTLMLEQQMLLDGGRILRVHDTKATKHLIDSFNLYQNF